MSLHPMILARILRKSDIKNKQGHYTIGHGTLKYRKGQSKNTIFKLPAGVDAAVANGYIHFRSEDGSCSKIFGIFAIHHSILKTDQ